VREYTRESQKAIERAVLINDTCQAQLELASTVYRCVPIRSCGFLVISTIVSKLAEIALIARLLRLTVFSPRACATNASGQLAAG